MTRNFSKVRWLCYINSIENYYELSSFRAQEKFLNTWRSPVLSEEVQVNANAAANARESCVYAVPGDNDGCDFESAVGIVDVECVGGKRRFRDLHELRRL